MNKKRLNLGLDLGSISLKTALLDENNHILFEKWMRVAGNPLGSLKILLDDIKKSFGELEFSSIGYTGSGRGLISEILKEAASINEISAHAAAVKEFHPEVKSVIEIGGQDSKLILFGDEDEISEFRMNELCAAGTGAFLDQQAARLGMEIEEFALKGLEATSPVAIAGRCAVFAKTDMTHHQQEGRPLPDIIAGLNEALARSYISNLVRGRYLHRPISFQGGVAKNAGLVAAFKKMLSLKDGELIIPKNHLTMGAIGAAIAARGSPPRNMVRISCIEKSLEKISEIKITQKHALPKLKSASQRIIDSSLKNIVSSGVFLGVDIGSVSVKLAALSEDGVIYQDYEFSDGRPLDVLRKLFDKLDKASPNLKFSGTGITGSGRAFLGKLIGADTVVNEITAQVAACKSVMPELDTIIEIGGQDAKFIRLEGGSVRRFEMNRVCAAGTGAFLQEQSARLGIDLSREFAAKAALSDAPSNLGARCTVFMESDLVSHQQSGSSKNDLLAGLAYSVITNYLEKVAPVSEIGDKILFTGGVAQNDAVASALENRLGKYVMRSRLGKVTGAIGAAIAAHSDKLKKKYSSSTFIGVSAAMEIEHFYCEDCENGCLISRAVKNNGAIFGGKCGKWDGELKSGRTSKSVISKRASIFGYSPSVNPGGSSVRGCIGIPRALITFDQIPLWRSFFESLGFKVLLSPPTNKAMLEDGMKHITTETCLPVKALCAHTWWLEKNKEVDAIFVPSLVFSERDRFGKDNSHCPYVQSAAQFASPVTSKKFLNPVVNWKWHPQDYKREMVRISKELGVSERAANRAWEQACEEMKKARSKLRNIGDNILARLKSGELKRAFLLLGKDYNLHDKSLNSGAAGLLGAMGEAIITQDMITDDSANYPDGYINMVWSHGKEIISAAHIASEIPNLFPVMITSFGCGPDSFTINQAREAARGRPFLLLEVDEHSSSVGMATRIEAFIDSLSKDYQPANEPAKSAYLHTGKIRRIFLSQFSDHGLAFAATFKKLGFDPVLLDMPNEESLKFGSMHSTSGECHPYTLMLGDYIKAATRNLDFSSSAYFTPDSALCRVGQFGIQIRNIAKATGLRLPVITKIQDILTLSTAGKSSHMKALTTYWEMMRGMDFFMQKFLETRAYEKHPGDADVAHEKGRMAIIESISTGKPLDGLAKAVAMLNDVGTNKKQRKFKIGITGDYYTRVCDFANNQTFREIEKMGGVVMLPSTLCEFVKYDVHQKPVWAIGHRDPAELIKQLVAKKVVYAKENRVRKIFGDGIDYNIPLEYERAVKYMRPYMSEKLPSGLTASVAGILEQIHAGADGILNLITFHCTYGLVISSVLSSIDRDYPKIPKLTLIFEGLKPAHNRVRLEAFMERVKSSAAGGKR